MPRVIRRNLDRSKIYGMLPVTGSHNVTVNGSYAMVRLHDRYAGSLVSGIAIQGSHNVSANVRNSHRNGDRILVGFGYDYGGNGSQNVYENGG